MAAASTPTLAAESRRTGYEPSLSASKSSVRRGARRCSILPQSNAHDASLRRVLASNLKIHTGLKCLLDFVVDRNACYCDILCIVCDLQRKFQPKQNLREITYLRFVRQLKRCSTQHPRKHRCLSFGSSDNHSRSTGAQSADASEVRNAPWTAGAYQTQWCTHRLSRHCGAYVSHAFKPLARSPPKCMRAIQFRCHPCQPTDSWVGSRWGHQLRSCVRPPSRQLQWQHQPGPGQRRCRWRRR